MATDRKKPPPRPTAIVRRVEEAIEATPTTADDHARLAWKTWMARKSENTRAAREADLTVLGRWLDVAEGPELPMRAAFAVLEGPDPKQARLLCRARIEQWAEDQAAAGLAATTIARRLSTMRSWLRELQDHGLPWQIRLFSPKYDPYNRAEGPPPAKVEEVIAALAKPAKTVPIDARDRALIVFLYDQALRRMSAQSLKLEHVELANQRVFVMVKGYPDRKSRSITKRTAAALRQWIKHRGKAPGPVFCSIARHTPDPSIGLAPNHYGTIMRKRKVATPNSPTHGLRHAAATALRDMGGDPWLVQALLGHKHIGTTQVYLDKTGDAAGRASRILAGEEAIEDG